jgi:hypothetical protein
MNRQIKYRLVRVILGFASFGFTCSALGMDTGAILQKMKETKKSFEDAKKTLASTHTNVTSGINKLSQDLVGGVDRASAQAAQIQDQIKGALNLLGSIPNTLGLSAIAMNAVQLQDLPGVLEYLVNNPLQTTINYMTALKTDYKNLAARYGYGGSVRIQIPGNKPGITPVTVDMAEAFQLADDKLGVAIKTLDNFIQRIEQAMED